MIAKKPETWRFCGGSYCYIVRKDGGKNEIYLASPDRKKITEAMLKSLKSLGVDFTDLWINDEESFTVKLSEDEIGFEVKHPELPQPEEWYFVKNWMQEATTGRKYDELVKIMNKVNCQDGVFGNTFTPIFSDEFPKSVSFTHPGLPAYDDIMEEAERRINVDFGKKTTKWTPGHRYDTVERSYYYISDAYSRILNRGRSGGHEKYIFELSDLPKIEAAPISLFLTKQPVDKSDIWSNVVTSIGERKKDLNYLDYIPKKCSAVDCGAWTEINPKDLLKNPQELRIDLMKHTLEHCCTEIEEVCGIKTSHYHDLNYFFEPLFLYFGEGDEPDMTKLGEQVNPLVISVLENVFSDIFGKNYVEYIVEKNSLDYKIRDMYSIFLSGYIRDTFYDKEDLYSSLFKSLGIDIKKVITNVISTFDPEIEMGNWEGFIKHNNLIPNREKHVDLRDPKEISRGGSYCSRPKEKATLSEIIPNVNLRQLLVDTIQWSMGNYKTGLDMFRLQKGYRKSDTPFYEILISLPNILNYLESERGGISEETKKLLVGEKFWSTFITAPENIKWEDEV